MTEEVRPNFLKSIKFEEEFLPFEKDTEIEFGGEKEVQRMIEFYLKNKGIENYKENAERFKINCVLGNNGGGKSNLLLAGYTLGNDYNMLASHRDIKFNFKHTKGKGFLDIKNNIRNNDGHGQIISGEYFETYAVLDDFFKLSGNINNSINKEVLNENNLNIFYCNIYNNLNGKFGSIFSNFFKTNVNNFALTFSTKNDPETIIDIESHSFYNFDENKYLSICNKINYGGYIIFEIYKKLKNNVILEYFYFSIIKNIVSLVKSPLYSESQYNILAKENLLGNLKKIEEILSLKDQYSEKINAFIESAGNENYRELHHFILENIKNQELGEIKKMYFNVLTKGEIETISTLFELNIKFNDLFDFNGLSAGEKTMLIRFTNIYKEILEQNKKENENKKTAFLILIDEPDLHLHLDWQRQYIQKLIDVFSTLDPEISLHFIIATHSPFIISDLPKESLLLLDKGEQKKYEGETFGANYIDIIKNGFFFKKEQMLMGSFAQNIIGNIAESERQNITNNKELHENHEDIKNNIGDEFLKDNLLYFKPEKND